MSRTAFGINQSCSDLLRFCSFFTGFPQAQEGLKARP